MKLPKDKKVYVIGQDGLEAELDEEGITHIGGSVRDTTSYMSRLLTLSRTQLTVNRVLSL